MVIAEAPALPAAWEEKVPPFLEMLAMDLMYQRICLVLPISLA